MKTVQLYVYKRTDQGSYRYCIGRQQWSVKEIEQNADRVLFEFSNTMTSKDKENVKERWAHKNKVYDKLSSARDIIEKFCDNVNYYERDLAGSWIDIRTEAEEWLQHKQ